MYTKNYRDIPAKETSVEGVTERWLITSEHGAENFSMRLLEVGPLISTPKHQHNSEHEIFVLVGRGEVITEEGTFQIREGSVVYVRPNEVHQFINTGASAMRLLDSVMFPSKLAK
ncbi:MAG TPA: cupin domain-containing protein [Anaerolineales bacterium]|nr:cupin domain-containing protein [Anaerolineales bacterium]